MEACNAAGLMDGATTIRFELVSKGGEQMRAVFARVVNLLMSASRELEHSQEAAKTSIHRAASLLQAQMRYDGTERQDPSQALLAWQMRPGEAEPWVQRAERVLVQRRADLLHGDRDRLALAGLAPGLAAHYPSCGGDGD